MSLKTMSRKLFNIFFHFLEAAGIAATEYWCFCD